MHWIMLSIFKLSRAGLGILGIFATLSGVKVFFILFELPPWTEKHPIILIWELSV